VDHRIQQQWEQRMYRGLVVIGTAIGHVVENAVYVGLKPDVIRPDIDHRFDVTTDSSDPPDTETDSQE
jgi:hypothetical protein